MLIEIALLYFVLIYIVHVNGFESYNVRFSGRKVSFGLKMRDANVPRPPQDATAVGRLGVHKGLKVAISSLGLLPVFVWSQRSSAKEVEIPTKGFQTKSGLKYFDVREGKGDSPRYGQVVSFAFALYYKADPDTPLELIDESGPRPFLHKHGNGRIVRGVDEALHTMKPGGQRRVIIPKGLGYTDVGIGPIPKEPGRRIRLGNIIDLLDNDRGQLIFDLQLVYVGDDDNDQGYYDDIGISQDEIRELAKKSLKAKNGGKGTPKVDTMIADPNAEGGKNFFKGQ